MPSPSLGISSCWLELGKLSSGRAAQLAGMPRVEFLLALRRFQVSPFQMTEEELRQDILNA